MIQLQSGRWPARYIDEVLDYQVDWNIPLEGDTITTVTATATNGQEIFDLSTSDGITTLWVKGGEDKLALQARVQLLAETAGGRKLGLNVSLAVQKR